MRKRYTILDTKNSSNLFQSGNTLVYQSVLTENGFYCSATRPRSSFYRSSNSILNVLKKPSKPVLKRLQYRICIPNLTYACDVVNYHHKGKESLHVALNDAVRRIYSYNRWESIQTLPWVTFLWLKFLLSVNFLWSKLGTYFSHHYPRWIDHQ